jgi:S-DNA-T family DNA segregation ATPase FtsK/SpoIIIE
MTTTLVKRPARIEPPSTQTNPLSIEAPPARGQSAPALAGASMMMMPIMSGTGSITVAITQKGRPIVAVAALIALIGSIAIGVLMMISQRSGTKRQVRESRERYLDYIEAMRHTVRDQITHQRAEQAWRYPRTDELLDICRDDARRWERRPSHPDFLAVRLGTGDVPLSSGLTLDADTGPLNDFDPVCLQAAQELIERYAVLRGQPITLEMASAGQISILGGTPHRRALATTVALQLATLHSPNDLQLAIVRSDAAASAWDWVKWLPHTQSVQSFDGDLPARRIEASVPAMAELLAPELEARLDRLQRTRGNAVAPGSHLVVIVDGDGLQPGHHLESPDPQVSLGQLGVHVISLLDTARQEPELVEARIQVRDDGSVVASTSAQPFTMDVAETGLPTTVARVLSSLRLTVEDAGDDGLSDTVGLPDILGVADPARIDLERTWRPRALRDLLRVPIGVGATGKTVMLDLKESAHGGMGPHGLVVGATGSGKSEMLRTLVSSLVIGHGPDRLALMLVDFKGGATFAAMEDIPHIAGMITNLQDDLTLVDRMRDALFGEMQRRQEILKEAGNLPNVTAYQDRIDAGEPLEPLPHLLVIVDEFSELLTAKPDFAELFVAIGRIGRSIGVHLLLATQKLEMGKIRGLESHLSYRIGLRTFSEGESRDAIGVPDAYHLPPEPGSGYLKVDTTVFDRFKAALVSSPYVPPSDGPKTTVPVVPYVALNGLGAWLAQQASVTEVADVVSEPGSSGTSVLDVLCRQMAASGRPQVRPVWLDPLPEQLPLGGLLDESPAAPGSVDAVLGLIDDPTHQAQLPLVWDFTGARANMLVVGSPATGKSVLLASMITSLAWAYAPGDVVFYCIDYGGGTLRGLEGLAHVASVAGRLDAERRGRTVNDVRSLIDEREQMFREHGIDSMTGWRRARADGRLPADVSGDVFLVIDGWGILRDEDDALDWAVSDIAARGPAYGVHVVITVTQSMQVRIRMQPAFGGRIEMRLGDVFDSEFGRDLMKQIPADAAGRGLSDVGGARQFQAALPTDDADADRTDVQGMLEAWVGRINERWPDRQVSQVQTLPETVWVDELDRSDLGRWEVPIGFSELNLGTATIDFGGIAPHLLVYGDNQTGKSTLLRTLVQGIVAGKSPDEVGIVFIDHRRSLMGCVPEEFEVAYGMSGDQSAGIATSIAESLRQRLPGADATPQQLRDRSWWSGLELFVVVDDYDLVSTSSGNPLQPLLELVAQASDLGFHLVIGRRIGGLARAMHEPLLQRLADVSTPGVVFSGDPMEGRLVNGVAARRLPEGRALYVSRDGRASQVQVARPRDDA